MSSPEIVLRLARDEELPAVGELTHAAYAHDYHPLSKDYAHSLRHPESRLDLFDVWVAEDAGTGALLGTTSILRPDVDYERRTHEEVYFRLLAVSPDARRRGVGSALTNLADRIARERGATTVSLNSGEQMHAAHALYRALGFVQVPERDVQIMDGDTPRTIYTFVRVVN